MPVPAVLAFWRQLSALMDALSVIHAHGVAYASMTMHIIDGRPTIGVYCHDGAALCRALGVAPAWTDDVRGGRFVSIMHDGVHFLGSEVVE